MRRSTWRILLLMGMVVAWAGLATPTLADHDVYFGSSYAHICDATPLSQCIANDAAHRYSLDAGLSSSRGSATSRAMIEYGGNSDITTSTLYPFDVIVYEWNRPDVNAFAWGQCAPQGPYGPQYGGSDAAHTRWCSLQYIVWNTWSAAANKVNTTAKYNSIGCHETGHTIGLRHRSTTPTTCMKPASSGPSDPNSVVPSIQDPAAADYTRINLHF